MERVKLFEVIAENFKTNVMAVKVVKSEQPSRALPLYNQSFFHDSEVVLIHGKQANANPDFWQNEFSFAHKYIAKHWLTLESGEVIDLEELRKPITLHEES